MARKPKVSRKGRARMDAQFNGGFEDMHFWRGLAGSVAPKERDPWRIGELATALQEASKLVGAHWGKVSALCDKAEKSDVTVSLSIGVNRANTPPEVAVNISYSEKYRDSLSAKVPDPDQRELPLQTDAGDAEPERKGHENPSALIE